MPRRLIVFMFIVFSSSAPAALGSEVARPTTDLKLKGLAGTDAAEMEVGGKKTSLHKGDLLDVWTLVEILPKQNAYERRK